MSEETKYCGNCQFFDKSRSSFFDSNTGYCPKKFSYVKISAKPCKDYLRKLENSSSSGCFITTIVCDVLGYDDNCIVLSTLRQFRENYLKPNIQYIPTLLEYDKIGPVIVEKIQTSPNKIAICQDMYDRFLIPCINYIKTQNYEKTIATYYNMVTELKNMFKLPDNSLTFSNTDINKIDITNIGKGRILTLKTSEF